MKKQIDTKGIGEKANKNSVSADLASSDPGLAQSSPAAKLKAVMEARLIGRDGLVERLLIALLVNGHVLIEGPPGLAKTRAVRLLADGIDGSFARIQCTPDLMPADVTGTQIFSPEQGKIDFLPGPVFNQLVLVDEINRAPPKVQSALLEAMAETQVTVGGVTRPLPNPFMVVATQNSIEHEGTFALPEAQLDRFLFHVLIELPDAAQELAILNLVVGEQGETALQSHAVLSTDQILTMRKQVESVHLSPALRDYIVRLVVATRENQQLRPRVMHAVSPRGSLSLAAAARARAYLHGRDYAVPEDVEALAADVLSHRLIPTWRAIADGDNSRSMIRELLHEVRAL